MKFLLLKFVNNKAVKFVICFFFSITLLLVSYKWANNSFTGDEEERFITEFRLYFNNIFGTNKQSKELDNLLLINVSNDKELVTVSDYMNGTNIGIPKGNTDITDRGKLARFFSKLQDKHKFIFLDITFNPDHKSKSDSLLQQALNNTKRIITPKFIGFNSQISKSGFNVETAFSAYKKSIYSNRFVKYNFLENETLESVALNMANRLDGVNIKKEGLFFYDQGKLCLNSIILDFKIKPIKKFNENGIQNFRELGVDVLDIMSNDEIKHLVKDKIILIGDFDDRDLHATVYGKIQGVLINYNAYLSLKNKKHILPNSLIFCLFFLYLIITISIVFNIDIRVEKGFKNYLLSKKWLKETINYLMSFKIVKKISSLFQGTFNYILRSYLKLGSLFIVISILFYLAYGIHVEILGATTIFGTLVLLRNELNKRSNIDD